MYKKEYKNRRNGPRYFGYMVGKKDGLNDLTLRNAIYLINFETYEVMSFNRTKRELKNYNEMDKKNHITIEKKINDDNSWNVMLTNHSETSIMVDRESIGAKTQVELVSFQRISVRNEDNLLGLFVDSRPCTGSENPTFINESYRLKECIGYGYTGNVFYSFSMNRMKPCALKRVNKEKFSQYEGLDCLDELQMLKELNHPNIIELYGYHDTDNYLYLELEYAAGGNLFDRLYDEDYGRAMGEFQSKATMYQMLSAVAYMHKLGVTHRDIKPENMLLMTRDEISLTKLADFGTSHIGSKGSLMTSKACTNEHAAPEILKRKFEGSEEPYTSLVDCWSLGVVIYESLSARQPFYDDSEEEEPIQNKIYRAEFQYPESDWKNISETPKDLINSLLVPDPKNRKTAEEALQHEWFQDDRLKETYSSLTSQWRQGSRPLAEFNL